MQIYKMKKLHHFFLINILKNEHKETVKVKKNCTTGGIV